MVDEWAEAWSYYLIKASADLATEKAVSLVQMKQNMDKVLQSNPQTYKTEVDELVPHVERFQDWAGLREQLKETGIRNSTLMVYAETSAYQIAQMVLNRLVRL